MYADDIVVLADSHEKVQHEMDILSSWCLRWGMKANIKKSQVIHHRNHQRRRCIYPVRLMNQDMEYVADYKYLGCWINEFGNNNCTVEALTSATSRSYGRIIGIFRQLGDMGYGSFMTLYNTYILPIANYAAAVWGFRDYPAPRVLQNKISHFYLGVHWYAPVPATSIEMDILNIQFTLWLEMVRYHNRLVNQKEHHLPRIIYEWERELKVKSWSYDLSQIVKILHLPAPDMNMVYDLKTVGSALYELARKR